MSMANDPRVAKAIQEILNIEHKKFGASIGLMRVEPIPTSQSLFNELVYAIDELGWAEDEASGRLAIQLIALSWEHSSILQRVELRRLGVSVLSRLGVGPSASMLESAMTDNGLVGSLNNYSSEVATVINQLAYSEIIGGVEYFLTRFQHEVLRALQENNIVGVSAPTSAGKSFALYLSIVRRALRDPRPIVYIVPTISLMNQVSRDLRDFLDRHGLEKWLVLTSFDGSRTNRIFVLTQERALPQEVATSEASVGLIVVDEVQNLERFSEDGDIRSKILLDSISEIYERSSTVQVVLSGPRVSNLGKLGLSLFGVRAAEVETSQAPVASLTYAISKDKTGPILTQYSEFFKNGIQLRVSSNSVIPGVGKSRYTDEYIKFIAGIISRLGGESRPIVFSPTPDQARKTAVGLIGMEVVRSDAELSAKRSALSSYVAESVHPNYDLVRCLKVGIGFHTGKVPPHIRMVCEMAYSEGIISTLACTTTLMQGVNLPANIVIARNPNLFINKHGDRDGPRLSPYEFSNLRGRAGRLMKDFVGRTLVLDGDSFDEDEEGQLFPDPKKEVNPSYRDLFERDRDIVIESLRAPGLEPESSKFLCSQIRYSILRHGAGAGERLATKGVVLGAQIIKDVARQLGGLDVGRDVCLANRYWDPFDLQEIKDNFISSGFDSMPNTPWKIEPRRVEDLLEFQAKVSPYYFDRYLGAAQKGRLKTLSISSLDWARETPLKEILERVYSPTDESTAIDSRVSDIQKHVIHGIPALLKPIADINGTGHGLLAAIESGVYTSVGRMLVAKGLYRDTAVTVRRKLLPQLDGDQDVVAREGLDAVRNGLHKLNYWVQRQVEPLLSQWERSI